MNRVLAESYPDAHCELNFNGRSLAVHRRRFDLYTFLYSVICALCAVAAFWAATPS